MLMKKSLLCFLFLALSVIILAQKDPIGISVNGSQRSSDKDSQQNNLSIYPVPVRENSFTIKSDLEISNIRVTNVIGQDIYRMKYITPQTISKVDLNNPQSGMYIVTISFSDETRSVRKILIEGYN